MPEFTILIVDDEAAIRDMVGITLDLAGFRSISAANAHDAPRINNRQEAGSGASRLDVAWRQWH